MKLGTHRRRGGLTLLEMLLVLALLVALGAIGWPLVRGSVDSGVLRDAAEQVRNELARARLAAMESGREQALTFLPGGDRYCVASADTVIDASTCACADGSDAAEPAAFEEPADQDGALPGAREGLLPDGVAFAADDGTTHTAAWADERLADGQPRGEEGKQVVFRPDGTCSDATITLCGADGYEITIDLRGLTAVATVGPLEKNLEATTEARAP